MDQSNRILHRQTDRTNHIPAHNRVCRIVKITVGRMRRARNMKTQTRFTLTRSYPHHLSVTKRTRYSRTSVNSVSRKHIGRGRDFLGFCPLQMCLHKILVQKAYCKGMGLCGDLSSTSVPPKTPVRKLFGMGGGVQMLFFVRKRQSNSRVGYEVVTWATTHGEF